MIFFRYKKCLKTKWMMKIEALRARSGSQMNPQKYIFHIDTKKNNKKKKKTLILMNKAQ